ncbi:Transcriptional repressor NrdR [uncultured archaeon]|nr:Transcriptional repressor NrdR [uncultured archaeon]
MKCPFCTNKETDVIDSRDTSDLASVRRRRECPSCLKRFTTYEKMEESAIIILKKDGRREKFDKQKLTNSILKSVGKRPVSYEKIIDLVNGIERDLRNRQSAEVKSTIIGEMVMKRLRKLDDIAYIRFAAVYKELKDLNDLRKELRGLEKK